MPLDPLNYPCGHPRTPENTQKVGVNNGFRCRTCRRRIAVASRKRCIERSRVIEITDEDIERGAKCLYPDYAWTSEHGQKLNRENVRRVVSAVLDKPDA